MLLAEINFTGSGKDGAGRGHRKRQTAGQRRAAESRRRRKAEQGQRAAFSRAASGNGFSKYSGKVVSAVRNRARFAIQAHCALLVTSMSPNCCFWNGILRKSHFSSQSSFENAARCPCSAFRRLLLSAARRCPAVCRFLCPCPAPSFPLAGKIDFFLYFTCAFVPGSCIMVIYI